VFTGIVSELGTVEAADRDQNGARLRIRAELVGELREGDSVSVAGACLTATALGDGWFEAEAMNQTLELTTLGGLSAGERVNLEPALRAGDPLGGHLVQGHVDGVGLVAAVSEDGFARRLALDAPDELGRYLAARGSVAIDGVSLTISAAEGSRFEVSLIPETLARTTLGALAEGARVNLEVDTVARYAERLLANVENEGDGQDD